MGPASASTECGQRPQTSRPEIRRSGGAAGRRPAEGRSEMEKEGHHMAEETPETQDGNGLSRRDLLAKAGAVGAGAVAAGSLAGGASAASKRSFATPTPRRGGTLTFGLESDPVADGAVRHGARRGALGQGAHVRLAGGVRQGSEHPARSRDVVEGRQDRGHLRAPQGRAVPQRQGADGGRRRLLRQEHEEPAAARRRWRSPRTSRRRSRALGPSRSIGCGWTCRRRTPE